MTAQKPIKAWGGFVNGELQARTDPWFGERWFIFRTRRGAREMLDEVRPVWITFTEPKGDGDG